MGKKNKKSRRLVPSAAKTAAQPSKLPRVGERTDFYQCHPVWSFAQVDFYAEVGGWIHLQPAELDELIARFRLWETMTWGQILNEGWKQNHLISVSKLIPKAQERLEVLKLDDLEELLSLRVNATARVYGILVRETFRILWWDPRHEICPAPLKNT